MKTLLFLQKRVGICTAVMITASVFMFGADVFIMTGILGGALLSVYKAAFWGMAPIWLAQKKPRAALWVSLLSQVVSAVVLTAAAFVNARLFFGVAAGLLSTAAVICVNTLTEKLGLTKNQWGEKPLI